MLINFKKPLSNTKCRKIALTALCLPKNSLLGMVLS